MTKQEFTKLSVELRDLVKQIPLHWGRIQNNRTDSRINMFYITTYQQLNQAICNLDEATRIYFQRRWFLWQCSRCDEYLFSINENVAPNPNPYDQTYDIEFDLKWRFDIKGTVIPQSMRYCIDDIIEQPQPMIDFFYNQQSTDVRHSFQNRLFIVHHSFVEPERELFLRCAWKSKQSIYLKYSQMVSAGKHFFRFDNRCDTDVIFIFEKERGIVSYVIYKI